MRSSGRITGVAIAVAAIALGGLLAATQAQADPPRFQIVLPNVPAVSQQPRLQFVQPNPYIAPPQQPRLGLYGHMEYGRGMVVDYVPWGTPASQTGLEPGDVIVRINGQWIQSDHDYFQALSYCGGVCHLLVQDVRTQGMVSVSVYLHGGSGPILYRSQQP